MFDLTSVLAFIGIYFAVFYGVSLLVKGYETKPGYIVADREAGVFQSTASMVGGWITGLGLLVSAQQFYMNGWVGYFWFSVPQVIGLLIFAWATTQINKRVPNGYTTSEWIVTQYGKGLGILFQVVFAFSALGLLSMTFTAIYKYINFINVGNSALITGLIVLGTAIYSLRGGMKVSLLTGTIQTLMNFVLICVLLYLGISYLPDVDLSNFITGKKNVTDLFEPKLFVSFAISATLTFITAPMMSAAHHQKSFSQQNRTPWKTWAWGGPAYFVMQTMIATFGLLACAWGGQIADPSIGQLVFFNAIGLTALALFGVILLNAGCMIIDAHGNAFASIVAHDYVKDETKSVSVARIAILGIATVAWLISLANIDLTYIFFTYGTLRVNLFIILVLILTTSVLTKRGIFWTAVVMCPATTALGLYGMINKDPTYNAAATVIGFFVTPAIAYVASRIEAKYLK